MSDETLTACFLDNSQRMEDEIGFTAVRLILEMLTEEKEIEKMYDVPPGMLCRMKKEAEHTIMIDLHERVENWGKVATNFYNLLDKNKETANEWIETHYKIWSMVWINFWQKYENLAELEVGFSYMDISGTKVAGNVEEVCRAYVKKWTSDKIQLWIDGEKVVWDYLFTIWIETWE